MGYTCLLYTSIAASVGGYPQNDVGFCTDILNGISKKEGISMAVRTLSPHLIFCDEIGRESEVAPIVSAMASGVMMAATAHGRSSVSYTHLDVYKRQVSVSFS